MKYILLFFASILVLSTSLTASQQETRYYIVPAVNSELIPKTSRIHMKNQSFYLISMRPTELSEFSAATHLKTNICGGYKDVTEQVTNYGLEKTLGLESEPAKLVQSFDKSQPTFQSQVEQTLANVNKRRYWDFLKTMSTSFDNRHSTKQDGLNAANWLAQYAQDLATAKGVNVEIRKIRTGPSIQYIQPSVVVRVPGLDSSLPAALIGGHMDTQGGGLFGGPINNKPGADDDASGVSTVMEAYNAILESGLQFKRDMYFAFYAAEEVGLVGSQYVVRDLLKRAKFRGVVQFDMTGFQSASSTKDFYFITDNVDPVMTGFLKSLVTEYLNIPLAMIGESKCTYACSDHASWDKMGVSAAFPSETEMKNMNHALHTSNDVISILSLDHAEKYIKLAVAFLVEAAEPN